MAVPPPPRDAAARPTPGRRSRRTLIVGVLLGLFSFMMVVAGLPDEPVNSGVLLWPIIVFSGLCSAFYVSMRRDRREYEQAYAAFRAQEAVTQDRFEIARNLHDIISDGLALIHLRASVARQLHAADPSQTVEAFTDIESASRATIKELRELLLVLRGESTPSPRHGAPAPTATMPTDSQPSSGQSSSGRLAQLIAPARKANLRVQVVPDDADRLLQTLPEDHQEIVLAGLREALANAARYAGPTQVMVSAHIKDGCVHLEVTDDGPVDGWEPIPGAGMGLSILRESASALGGQVVAGPKPGSPGFSVAITLPTSQGKP